MKVLTVVGARPQFIKAVVMNREFSNSNKVEEVIAHTGQHFDRNMSEIFFDELDIPKPKYNLEIGGVSHCKMTGRMLEKLEELMLQEKPEVVLVYGDANSTLATALAASKLHVLVLRVEAGLRSFNMNMQEEINRIITDRLSNFLFCPTQAAMGNLVKEDFDNQNAQVLNVGDIMLDASMYHSDKLTADESLSNKTYILCTIHRAENTDNREILKTIVDALNELHKTVAVILPLHPRTKEKLQEYCLDLNVTIINPASYLDMINLVTNSSLLITDSGGLQKEANFFKKKCVTIREQTEWVELIDAGANVLSPAKNQAIVKNGLEMLKKEVDFSTKLYGEGNTGKEIMETILSLNK